jgi:hypothetical protein
MITGRGPRRCMLLGAAVLAALVQSGGSLPACEFCSAVSLTLSEEIQQADVAVLARLIEVPPKPQPGSSELRKARFQVTDVLKGAGHLPGGSGSATQPVVIQALYFGSAEPGKMFFLLATEPPQLNWGTPIPLTDRAVAYIKKLPTLPAQGPDRLVFFQEHFEDPDDLLARDAYDEFAKAPHRDVQDLGPRMQRDKLLRWIADPKVIVSRKRLYLTMLGICGQPEDAGLVERMLTEKSDEPRTGLDAAIACYLMLRGPEGMKLVEDLFLANHQADYTETYAAIMALRFHANVENRIPKERLLVGFRKLLDRPELADLVIPDLARMEDWSVMDRLVELFKKADDKSSWVRVPVVQYLMACPLPKAEAYLEQLEKIDPESVKRASFFLPLGGSRNAPPVPPPGGKTPPATQPEAGQSPQR